MAGSILLLWIIHWWGKWGYDRTTVLVSLKVALFSSYSWMGHCVWFMMLVKLKIKVKSFHLIFSTKMVLIPHAKNKYCFYQQTNMHILSLQFQNKEMTTMWVYQRCQDSSHLLTSASCATLLHCGEEGDDTSDTWVLISAWILSPVIQNVWMFWFCQIWLLR